MAKTISKNQNKSRKQIVKYKDLLSISTQDNNELFIKLNPKIIPNGYMPKMNDMETITGKHIFVRDSIFKKLKIAQKKLKEINPNYTLYVTYGYRSPEVQTKKFLEQLHVAAKRHFSHIVDLYEKAHKLIAVPTVAGHPTGGAIDIVIKDEKTNRELDFGSKQYNFSTKDCEVFTKKISSTGKANRILLRELLMDCGFAPFDGEWWHFSYGDREWAYYYKQNKAIYSQKNVNEVLENVAKIT
jgi:D-alanyl-D-alanine dipeptidase